MKFKDLVIGDSITAVLYPVGVPKIIKCTLLGVNEEHVPPRHMEPDDDDCLYVTLTVKYFDERLQKESENKIFTYLIRSEYDESENFNVESEDNLNWHSDFVLYADYDKAVEETKKEVFSMIKFEEKNLEEIRKKMLWQQESIDNLYKFFETYK